MIFKGTENILKSIFFIQTQQKYFFQVKMNFTHPLIYSAIRETYI
jgi:ribosomal protein L23